MSGRYERVMSSVAWGPYHKMLTIVCGCINASDSVAVTSLSFVIPNASATLNISDEEKGLLMSCDAGVDYNGVKERLQVCVYKGDV
ncbi:hypothetical protein SARC_08670 [Sphaeroforma arctica JP610]|uniref:Uncharacterized protein n=1 Tax=Sphaeroforma arctica JP610 TaxID=667725 RepID=A0A0L0FQ29_9EUKA|nr:hypothetical protein SARC_08670 [Sphaeroforma arctica JP610]KNC78915.1 hypothetical protein SARC_08670 [Sphaeroforma arctica JP610]|eukprot:XP_014152817.1 hypothetical protein SARC_08670 [Sphaeroforma arctica JP610]